MKNSRCFVLCFKIFCYTIWDEKKNFYNFSRLTVVFRLIIFSTYFVHLERDDTKMTKEILDLDKNRRLKLHAQELSKIVERTVFLNPYKKAVLLCEGTKDSIDVALYSAVYPEFIVLPEAGCTDIQKFMPFMNKYVRLKTYAIIDRDNHSKKGIKSLKNEKNVFCTKLPFIENIICCPEVLKIVAPLCGKDYAEVLVNVRKSLSNILADKLRLLNPFNVSIPDDEEIQMFTITIVTKNNVIANKVVDLNNIMYTFRDKGIVVEVAYALGLHNKYYYYEFIKELLKGEHKQRLINIMSKYLPEIKIES